jgi:hypothetical protein
MTRWTVYLSGEIHSDWRDRVTTSTAEAGAAHGFHHARNRPRRQWNAAFDAGLASALSKQLVTLHDADLNHAPERSGCSSQCRCAHA